MIRSRALFGGLLFVVVLLAASWMPASAEDPPVQRMDWGFSFSMAAGSAGGEYGDFLEKPIAWDLAIFRERGPWRIGGGLSFASLTMKSPYEDELEWGHMELFGSGTRMFRPGRTLRPYVQVRAGLVRIHPRADSLSLFATIPEEDIEVGDSQSVPANGFGVSIIPGIETALSPDLAIDLAGYVNLYATGEYDLTPIDRSPANSGTEMGLRMGLTWRPASLEPSARWMATPPDTTPLDPAGSHRDAWGVTRSHGWAVAEVVGMNFCSSLFNEYVRNANFNQVSPRSFWDNIEHGFTYDDNGFRTNQILHPLLGSTYYNASRANGLGFWTSTLYAIGGAFMWEAAGETHPMSVNDMVSTGPGGIAFGEAAYRVSSVILDNTSVGSGRTWREIGAFLVDPIRGFNRLLSGRSSRQDGNPSSPYDWRPPRYGTTFATGVRVVGKGESISDSTKTHGFIEVRLDHGSPWENQRRHPFDHFDLGCQLNIDEKVPIGRLQIRGDLFSKPFGGGDGRQHAVAFTQNFDYANNSSYEFGGQSFGAALFSRFRPSSNVRVQTRVDATGLILGAVNADYSFLAEVADQERYREYDYGPGLGGSAEVSATFPRGIMAAMLYRFQWISTKNGSVFNTEEYGGSDANHYVQMAGMRVTVPIRGVTSAGLDGSVFLRDSFYSSKYLKEIRQRNPQVRAYLTWAMAR